MKYIKIFIAILIVVALIFGGYKGYNLYKQWDAKRYNEIEILRKNQDMFLKKVTDLSETITRIINDNIKTTTVVKPDHTYESLKDEVIELKKDEEANKEEIARLKADLSAQRKAFLASDDTIYIKTITDDTLLLYRDTEGTLQPASANIDKIIEHRELSESSLISEQKEIVNNKTSLNIKAGAYYSLQNTYGVILSKEIFGIWDCSLNASLLLADFEDFKLMVGADVGYEIRDNLELGIGYNTDKEYYIKLQYQF